MPHQKSGTDYDERTPLGRIPAGTTAVRLSVPGGLGSADRVRPRWDGPDGIVEGPVAFVIDPLRVSVTAADVLSGRDRPDHSPTQLAVEARFLDMWVDHITQVSTAISTVTLPRLAGTPADDEVAEADHGARLADDDAWLRYTDDAKRHLGGRVVDFALGGFPRLADPDRVGSSLELATPIDELVDERAAALEGDDADEVNEETDPFADEELPPPAEGAGSGKPNDSERDEKSSTEDSAIRRVREDRHRRRIRERLRELIGQAPQLHPLARQSVALLVIVAQQSNVFDGPHGKDGYGISLADALRALEHIDARGRSDIHERLVEPLASTAAVGVYLLHEVLPLGIRTSEVLAYRAVLDGIGHLLPYATPEHIAGFVGPMHNQHGFPIDPADVMRIAELAVQNDPLLMAKEQLERKRHDWNVHRHGGRLLHVHSGGGLPFNHAAEALELLATVENAPGVAACWATNDRGDWCLVAREGQDVWRVEPMQNGTSRNARWTHHVLRPLMGPAALRDADTANRTRQHHGPWVRPIPEAIAAFVRCGADVTNGPPANCSD